MVNYRSYTKTPTLFMIVHVWIAEKNKIVVTQSRSVPSRIKFGEIEYREASENLVACANIVNIVYGGGFMAAYIC